MTFLPSIDAGQRIHRVTFQNPGDPISDGYGGYTEGWADCVPPFLVMAIKPASAADMERIAAGTVTATATHVMVGPYHPEVTTKSRAVWADVRGKSHECSIAGVVNPDARCIDMIVLCEEKVE